MKEIPLTKGLFAYIDDGDYDEISKYKWHAHNHSAAIYAARSVKKDGVKKIVYMHRQILGFPTCDVDHINGYALDNRRDNIRIVSRRTNLQNLHRSKTSIYPGVIKYASRRNFHVRPRFNGKQYYIGAFKLELDAFAAYRVACAVMGEPLVGVDS